MLFHVTGNCIKHTLKLIFKNTCLCLLIIPFACNKPRPNSSKTALYDKILDSASHTYDTGHPEKAIRHLDSVIKPGAALTPQQWFLNYTYHYNYFYFIEDDKDAAMMYADKMLQLFDTPEKKLEYAPQFGQANIYKGGILFDQGKYEDAYQYYYKGKLIASNNLDNCTLSDYNYRLGMITYKQEHYHSGAVYFKTGWLQSNKCGLTFRSFLRRQELLNNTGLCYSKINEGDSALIYFNMGLKFIDTAGVHFTEKEDLDVGRGVIYGNMANIYIKRKNYLVAEDLLNKSISINLRPNNDNRDAQLSELKLAHLYLLQNKNDSLIRLLRKIGIQSDSIKNQVAEADWNGLMASYYIKMGQSETAFKYLVKQNALKDSVANKDKNIKETDINQQMDRLHKNYEFDSLKRNNRLQHIFLKIAVVFGLMLLLIIFLIFRNWQKSKKNIITLGELNRQINDQNYDLEQALAELNLSSREKDRILRTVAHDLRNPLGGVAALTAIMAAESEYTDEQKELINLIRETSNDSIELINEILEATDNAPAKLAREKEPIEINALLNHSVELMRFKAAEKDQQIALSLLKKPLTVLLNREQIWRVISNLISNAIKFSPDKTTIRVTVDHNENAVEITVADEGIGIPDDISNAVFNIFTNAKRPGTAGEKSFGLGLSICQQIVENHKGKIWFTRNPQKGTTFHVSLPLDN